MEQGDKAADHLEWVYIWGIKFINRFPSLTESNLCLKYDLLHICPLLIPYSHFPLPSLNLPSIHVKELEEPQHSFIQSTNINPYYGSDTVLEGKSMALPSLILRFNGDDISQQAIIMQYGQVIGLYKVWRPRKTSTERNFKLRSKWWIRVNHVKQGGGRSKEEQWWGPGGGTACALQSIQFLLWSDAENGESWGWRTGRGSARRALQTVWGRLGFNAR